MSLVIISSCGLDEENDGLSNNNLDSGQLAEAHSKKNDVVGNQDKTLEYKGEWLSPEEIQRRLIINSKLKLQEKEAVKLSGVMVSLPSGEYEMGSDSAGFYEEPVHEVVIRAFRIGEREVTQKQWRMVMGNDPSYFKGCDDCPVEKVSWNDVHQFIKRLNYKTGQKFRLPTEAEWEYACRSGGSVQEYCGGFSASSLGWTIKNSGRRSHEAGLKKPNQFGLYDMTGNVWEWVEDCWNESYKNAPLNGTAWSTGDCNLRVLRGGSWDNNQYDLRSTYRNWEKKNKHSFTYGFRLAQD